MKVTGHKTRAMFDRYAITNEQDIEQALIRHRAMVVTAPATNVVNLAAAREARVK